MDHKKKVRVQSNGLWKGKTLELSFSIFDWFHWIYFFVLLKLLVCPDICSHTQRSPLVSSSHQHKGQKVSISGFTWQHGHEGLEKLGESNILLLPSSYKVVSGNSACRNRKTVLIICLVIWCPILAYVLIIVNILAFYNLNSPLHQARYLVDEVKDKSGQQIDALSWKQEGVQSLPLQENGYFSHLCSCQGNHFLCYFALCVK